VAMKYWKQMREKTGRNGAEPGPTIGNPWRDQPTITLRELGNTPLVRDDDRQERYNEWAARLRQPPVPVTPEPAATSTAGYWSSETLFADSRRLAEDSGRPNPWRTSELLQVLDLREGATPTDVGAAYRRLAKDHHPDRFVEADPAIQAFHAERMLQIIEAYRELRELQGV
jgi:DnaJ-domain-containing protein 1